MYFGAWVRLEDEAGEIRELRIVGSDEIDTRLGWISLDSPMARAIIGKSREDSFVLKLPNGDMEYYIADVSYEPFP